MLRAEAGDEALGGGAISQRARQRDIGRTAMVALQLDDIALIVSAVNFGLVAAGDSLQGEIVIQRRKDLVGVDHHRFFCIL